MFRKIVTELIYSPALAGNLGDYIKRLRYETSRRQIGVTFVFLAIMVQLFATLFPPESANANNPAVLIDGGAHSTEDLLRHYDQNTKNIRDLLTSLGIGRSDVENTIERNSIPAGEAIFWSMQDSRQSTTTHYFQTGTGNAGVAYYQPLSSPRGEDDAFVGSSNGNWFAILKGSGSLITEKALSPICVNQVSSSEPLLLLSQESTSSCSSALELSLTARDISPNATTPLEKVGPSDRIAYSVSVSNTSDKDISLAPAIGLEDILEYSRILDNGGGEYDFDTRTLNWPAITLAARETAVRRFTIQLLPTIPSTARGEHLPDSYDCLISSSFGNTVAIPVACPFTKHIESISNHLPALSIQANLIFANGLLFTTLYLYLRAKQRLSELYIIRHIHLGGM